MDAETRPEERVLRERASRRRLGLWLAGLAFALGCFTQKPSRESTPSAPAMPAAAPSSEAELPAEQAAPPPLPTSEPSREQKQEEPASGKGAPPAASPSVAPPRRAAPAKPASKARSAGPESAADRAIGGNADDVERDAPALRQRLDRAYRAGSPDCPSARERKKAVCDLATQICQLTDRDPNVASVAEYCSEAKQRCSQAEQRTQERCPD